MSTPPLCSWLCDDPQCPAECKIYAQPPSCICENTSIVPVCTTVCDPDSAYNQCPLCEVQCVQDSCPTSIQCNPVEAAWACRKPSNCPQPTCELNCNQPACEYQGPNNPWEIISNTPTWAILLLSVVIPLLFFLVLQTSVVKASL